MGEDAGTTKPPRRGRPPWTEAIDLAARLRAALEIGRRRPSTTRRRPRRRAADALATALEHPRRRALRGASATSGAARRESAPPA